MLKFSADFHLKTFISLTAETLVPKSARCLRPRRGGETLKARPRYLFMPLLRTGSLSVSEHSPWASLS